MELWDVLDRDRRLTGRTMRRGDEMAAGDYHLVVHVCLFNTEGEMLIQQRQPFKQGWSGLWDVTVGGSAVAGDSSQSAAQRETLEEIGHRLDLRDIQPQLTINFPTGFDDYYLIEAPGLDANGLKLQYEEVKQVKWASREEIMRLIGTNEFIPYRKSLIDLLFDMRQGYGAIAGR